MKVQTDKEQKRPVRSIGKEVAQNQRAIPTSNKKEITEPVQKKTNRTGLPDNLKAGIENLSGYSMDDVNVHYNSNKPAQLQAHAFAQGTDIHLASGQERHLPHEAWHVVQQKQGRVQPTMQMKGGVNVNDNAGLEREADVMGTRAVQMMSTGTRNSIQKKTIPYTVVQRIVAEDLKKGEDYQKGGMKKPLYKYLKKEQDKYIFIKEDTLEEVSFTSDELLPFKVPKAKKHLSENKGLFSAEEVKKDEELDRKVIDHGQLSEKLHAKHGGHNAFTGDVLPGGEDIPSKGESLTGAGKNLKSVLKVELNGKKYVRASMDGKDQEKNYNNLGKEAKLLSSLAMHGLDVPKVHSVNKSNEASKTGVNIVENKPFIIMDFVPGTFIDIWKRLNNPLKSLKKHISEELTPGMEHKEIEKIKTGLNTILSFIKTTIVVDLQVIIEKKTGRTVIIDPQSTYPLDAASEEHLKDNEKSIALIGKMLSIVDSAYDKHLYRNDPELWKASREKAWEKTTSIGQYPHTNALIGRNNTGTDRASLSQQDMMK